MWRHGCAVREKVELRSVQRENVWPTRATPRVQAGGAAREQPLRVVPRPSTGKDQRTEPETPGRRRRPRRILPQKSDCQASARWVDAEVIQSGSLPRNCRLPLLVHNIHGRISPGMPRQPIQSCVGPFGGLGGVLAARWVGLLPDHIDTITRTEHGWQTIGTYGRLSRRACGIWDRPARGGRGGGRRIATLWPRCPQPSAREPRCGLACG